MTSISSVLLIALAEAMLAAGGDVVLNGPDDLKKEYYNIFKTGNRNAASHLWASFILDRSGSMSEAQLKNTFKGFCPVSGSPLPDSPRTLYKVKLPTVAGDVLTGVTHHCCWPCICDTSDFIRVDTKTITTSDGSQKQNVLVIGDPCSHPDKLKQSYMDPFSGQSTLLSDSAPELSCVNEGGQSKLKGATYSDNGYPILGLFFSDDADISNVLAPPGIIQENDPTFGYGSMCLKRRQESYNSGMGLIFHLVANISPIRNRPALPLPTSSLQQKDVIMSSADPSESRMIPTVAPVAVQSSYCRFWGCNLENKANHDAGLAPVFLAALGVLCVALLALRLRSNASSHQVSAQPVQLSDFQVLE